MNLAAVAGAAALVRSVMRYTRVCVAALPDNVKENFNASHSHRLFEIPKPERGKRNEEGKIDPRVKNDLTSREGKKLGLPKGLPPIQRTRPSIRLSV